MSTDLAPVASIPTLAHLPADQQRARAREMARAEPGLTGAALAARFGRRERWGRQQLAAARTTTAGTAPARTTQPAQPTSTGPRPGNVPDPARPVMPAHQSPLARGGRAEATGNGRATEAGRADRWTVRLTGTALGVVMLSPMALSAQSLAGWAHQALGLTGPWAWVVPVTLDAAALVCVGLTFHAMLRGDSAGAARLLVWVFAGASALANWRHGTAISADAAVYYPAMPLITALLLDITLRRVRRTALAGIGALERPLPRYRAARWAVAPIETWRAWSTAVREGITDPAEALAVSRRRASTTCTPRTGRGTA